LLGCAVAVSAHGVSLFGSLQSQGFGDDVSLDTNWVGTIRDPEWFKKPIYAKYAPGRGGQVSVLAANREASFGTARLEITAKGVVVASGRFDKAALDALRGTDAACVSAKIKGGIDNGSCWSLGPFSIERFCSKCRPVKRL
jgi:hypothetical protein